MLHERLHAFSYKTLGLNDLTRALRSVGLSPMFSDARAMLSEQLTPFGLATPQVFDRVIEVFVSSNREQAVLARVTRERQPNGEEPVLFDLVVLSRTQSVDILKRAITETLRLELLENSYRETVLMKMVRDQITGVSPNGRLLEDRAVDRAATKLADDGIREQLKEISATFRSLPVTRFEFDHLPIFGGKPEAIDRLMSEGALSSSFQMRCKSCGNPSLIFTTSAEAEQALHGSIRCACGESRLHIVQAYSLESAFQRALQQGLWLEALVRDVIDRYACAQWHGRMLGTHEIDAFCVVAGMILMLECKDRNFGQNDLYVAAAKAQRLRADMVVIVSTRSLHSNVEEEIAVLNQQRGTDGDRFVPIIHATASELRSQLEALLNQVQKISLRNWLTRRPTGEPWAVA